MSNNYWENYGLDSGRVNKVEGVFPSYFHQQRYVKDTFKVLIERALKDTQAYKFYPQARDYSNTFVTVSFPYERADFPVVTVDSLPGSSITSDYQFFVRDLYDPYGNITGERYGSIVESSLNINVYAKSTIERDEMADIIGYNILHSKRKALESEGIIIQNISTNSQSEEEFGTDKIYSLSIEVKLYSHWYSDTLYEHVTSIFIDPETPGPANDPGPPIVPISETIYIDPPDAGPKPISPRMAQFLEGAPCCGVCGGHIPRENTGALPGSRFYEAATGQNLCNCKHDQKTI